ncbi:MAG: membrane or secreted protein [Bacteroidota bacterium]
MKKLLTTLLTLSCFNAYSQDIQGAWEGKMTDENGQEVRNVVILADGYQVSTHYNAKTGAFISTSGGSWSQEGNKITEIVEFDTKNPDRVGSEVSFDIEKVDGGMKIVGSDVVMKRIDNMSPGALSGAWLMSGRKRNGEISERDTNRPRKTMKILSGTRFQWIAYNTETREFKGTGGGTYTTVDGKYTENIEFFSRDNSRVGASLEFDFELKEGKWHHWGFSSKGDPLYEIWSLREK